MIVIGTGVGGSTLGYSLASQGLKVLFIEKGKTPNPSTSHMGSYMEDHCHKNGLSVLDNKNWANAGRWRVRVKLEQNPIEYPCLLGSGGGGSTAIYGMVMERFFPTDFTPKRVHPGDTESTLPDSWPISYKDFVPYYEKAEKLYRATTLVPDPFLFPDKEYDLAKRLPHFHWAGRTFLSMLAKNKGLHPYGPPMACDWMEDCRFCQGFLCPKACKNDANKNALVPAVQEHGAALLTSCEVVKILSHKDHIEGVLVELENGERYTIYGKKVALAAGAIRSPLLLLDSRNDYHPSGLANSSGYVGRNLMRHLIDLYLLPSIFNFRNSKHYLKEGSWNDFYEIAGVRFGTSQSFGKFPESRSVHIDFLDEIAQNLPHKTRRILLPLISFFTKLPIDYLFNFSGCLSPIMEDTPQWNNRVLAIEKRPHGDLIKIQYKISNWDQERLQRFRGMIKKTLFPPYPFIFLPMAEKPKMLAHACGTVRFGTDPKTSALDPWNESHDVKGLYIVDASFFPSSAGTNPSLTIAANSLRVADRIVETHSK